MRAHAKVDKPGSKWRVTGDLDLGRVFYGRIYKDTGHQYLTGAAGPWMVIGNGTGSHSVVSLINFTTLADPYVEIDSDVTVSLEVVP